MLSRDQHMHFCEVNALRRLSGLACSGLGASPTVFHDGLVSFKAGTLTGSACTRLPSAAASLLT